MKMFCNWFSTVFVVLLLAFCSHVVAERQDGQTEKGIVDLFVPGTTKVSTTQDDKKQECSLGEVEFPFLVATDDIMVAIAGANCTGKSDGNIDIVAKYIEAGGDWASMLVKANNDAKWKTKFAVRNEKENNKLILRGIAAAAKKNEVYLLMRNYTLAEGRDSRGSTQTSDDLNIKLVVGTVSGNKDSKTITWTVEDFADVFNTAESKKHFGETYLRMRSSIYSIMTGNKDVIFVASAVGSINKKNPYALVHLTNTGGTKRFETSYLTVDEDCFSNFISWEENKIIMISRCENGYSYMKESSDLGKTWVNITGSITRLPFLSELEGIFTLANIENKNVLLFAQQSSLPINSNGNYKNVISLSMTDGNRVYVCKPISTDDGSFFLYGLLYSHAELFSLQQQGESNGSGKFVLWHFKDELTEIKSALKLWERVDNAVVAACKKVAPSNSFCAPAKVIDGLVGFLSNTSNGNSEWKDEYMYVNAVVTRGEKVTNGFRFSGAGAGAKWSVGRKLDYELYDFTNPGCTLVASVLVGSVAKGKDNSVMGVGLTTADSTFLGLWCTAGGVWGVSGGDDNEKRATSRMCGAGVVYIVALKLEKEKIALYVDGEQLTGIDDEIMTVGKANKITHFYFGADNNNNKQNDVVSSVTVMNVLLYNRPFTGDDIGKLRIPKDHKGNPFYKFFFDGVKRPSHFENSMMRGGVCLLISLLLYGSYEYFVQ